jgi:DNA-directed RNA polymerase specialized sigma24 family protein
LGNTKLELFFDKIYKEYALSLLKWATSKTSSPEEAEDLTQEIFYQVFKSIKREFAKGNT